MTKETKCFFDVAIDGQDAGRVVFKLYQDKCPKTCENFRCLCTGERGLGSQTNKPLHFKGTRFHRVVRNFIIQGGDIVDGNGKGGDSIYGGSFADENLTLAHDEPYLLSMANRGPDTNRSQFFITTNEAPHLDGKHVVFGRVVSGLDTVLKIERLAVDSKARPVREATIKNCGEIPNAAPAPTSSPKPETNLASLADDKQTTGHSHEDLTGLRPSNKRPRSPSTDRRSSCSSSPSSSSSSSCSSQSTDLSCHSSRHSGGNGGGGGGSPIQSQTGTTSASKGRQDKPGQGITSGDRSPSCCSRSSASGSASGGPRGNRSPISCSSTTSSASSTGSSTRSRRLRPRNRRFEETRKIEDSARPRGANRASRDTIRRGARVISSEDEDDTRNNKHEEDIFVNPHYKCSVRPDEIPDIPTNRFLARVAPEASKKTTARRPKSERSAAYARDRSGDEDDEDSANEQVPFQSVDLSKFEDLPEEGENNETADGDNGAAGTVQRPTVTLKSSIKASEPLVSRSGRIMKGRGQFKFRTPSPEPYQRSSSSSYRNRRRRSPPYYRGSGGSSSNQQRRHWSAARRSRSRSRSPGWRRTSDGRGFAGGRSRFDYHR